MLNNKMQKAAKEKVILSCTDLSEINWIDGVSHFSNRDGTLDVWMGDLTEVSEDEIILLKNKLSFDKVVKTDRFRSSKDRSRYILAHGMLQEIIKQYTGEELVEIAFTKYKKPYLPKYPNLSFNMSHSGNLVLIAFRFDGIPVGVDVEYINSALDTNLIAESYYHEDEQKAVFDTKDPQLFFKLWTRKEALLKAMEVGLTEEIKKINTLPADSGFSGSGVLSDFNGHSYDIQSFKLGNHYFGSLATLKNSLSYSFVSF